ncbi:Carboxymethylenebutenolidase [Bertholletia excelsa]
MTRCMLYEKNLPKKFWAEAAYTAVNQALWLRKILIDLNLEQKESTEILIDNQAAIFISHNPVFHGKTKHFNIKLFFLREVQKNGAVILIHCKEWWGVEFEIKNHALKISELDSGYRALIPDLYRGKVGLEVVEAQHLMDGLDWQGVVKDICASVNWLNANGSRKVGVTGFCMGGALSIASSVLVPEVDAVVAFYGVLSSELADPAQAKAPIQAHFGKRDNFVGFSAVTVAKALEEKLKVSGVPHEVFFYPGVGHAFMNSSPEIKKRRKSMGMEDVDEAVVELAWSRFHSWMSRYFSP